MKLRFSRRLAVSAATALLVAAGSAHADTAKRNYADTLLDEVMLKHRNVRAITISATAKDGQAISVTHGKPGPAKAITLPLANSMGEPIGTVAITFARKDASAPLIAARLSRRIYVSDNLRDADPFVAGSARAPFAQGIVERMIDGHPDLITLAMHVAPPGGENIILASNFGRIGKLADKDDMHVINDGAVLREMTNGGHRLAVELPQLDRAGKVIGALSTSFTITPGQNADQAYAKAVALRDEIARATPSLAALTAR